MPLVKKVGEGWHCWAPAWEGHILSAVSQGAWLWLFQAHWGLGVGVASVPTEALPCGFPVLLGLGLSGLVLPEVAGGGRDGGGGGAAK